VALSDLQAALRSHPEVENAQVVAIPELSARPAVAVVTSDFVSGPELRRYVRAKLGADATPDLVAFVPDLPLAQGLAVFRGQAADSVSVYRFISPRSDLERELARLWQGLLGQPDVGVQDDFLELGGDSLSAISVLTEVHAAYAVEVSLVDLFTLATIERLAARIEADRL
jgi:tyrocidine synthetase-3